MGIKISVDVLNSRMEMTEGRVNWKINLGKLSNLKKTEGKRDGKYINRVLGTCETILNGLVFISLVSQRKTRNNY